jgi:transaldolase/glucose-6-phosphate isomerase
MAYQEYKRLFSGARWDKLAAKGAKPQRLLWASTGTKNKDYSDVLYVEELIGPDTINTVPPATLEAFPRPRQAARQPRGEYRGCRRVLSRAGKVRHLARRDHAPNWSRTASSCLPTPPTSLWRGRAQARSRARRRHRRQQLQLGGRIAKAVEKAPRMARVCQIRRLWQHDNRLDRDDEDKWLGWLQQRRGRRRRRLRGLMRSGVKGKVSPTPWCSAWADRASVRKCWRRPFRKSPGFRSCTC